MNEQKRVAKQYSKHLQALRTCIDGRVYQLGDTLSNQVSHMKHSADARLCLQEVLQSEQPPPMSAPPQAPQPGAPNPSVPWLEQMTTSAQDQQPTSNQQQQPNASSTQLMHPSLPGQYPMPGFGPHTGMQVHHEFINIWISLVSFTASSQPELA